MARFILAFLMMVGLVPVVPAAPAGQETGTKQTAEPGKAKPASDATGEKQTAPPPKSKQASENTLQGFVSPAEFNVYIEPDMRTLIVMAAINMAGYDSGTLTGARAEIRKDLANMDPELRGRLAAFYQSKRRAGVDESADVLRYEALSLLMTPPPLFSIHGDSSSLPQDLQPLVGFVPLLQDFYQKSGIKQVLPKYVQAGRILAASLRLPVGNEIFETLSYFHSKPDTIIGLKPLIVDQGTGEKQKIVARTRTRYVFVISDPFTPPAASWVRDDILNEKEDLVSRRRGDDYIVGVGPGSGPRIYALRQALIRFVIDPLLERHLKTSLQFKDPIVKLVGKVPTAEAVYASSVYLVMRDSLAVAAETRMMRVDALEGRRPYSEDDAVFDLASAYRRGAVLAFHFYDALSGYEKVGINIDDFLDQMLATTNFDREAARPDEFGKTISRVAEARAHAKIPAEMESSARPPVVAPGLPPEISEKILLSDDMVRQRRFADARPLLDQVLKSNPNNARALYGMAQVVNQTPSTPEVDPKADENDKIQAQHDRLESAIKLYRKAIENASLDNEKWMVEWSHVFIGRILDFQEFRADALAEYEKAIALGDCPNGAYREALEGKAHPYGQK
jgi:tetratricopeptide (TPR) repeat protein